MSQTPSIGRIVHYTLSKQDVDTIRLRRKPNAGNEVNVGDVYPAIVVRSWSAGSANLQVFLDGNDTFWATSVSEGEGERTWAWPPRV